MTTSGTTNFNPSLGELTLHAFNLCGIRPTQLTQEYMQSARMATNLMLSSWSNQGVNLWKVSLVTGNLTTAQSVYTVNSSVIMILDAYVSTTQGTTTTDRIILPVSRSEYASYPNKDMQGFPTVFWFDRLISPTITIWPVPDTSQGPSTYSYYAVSQIEDANLTNGQTIELPYRWMDAFAFGLAHRLSQIWAPQITPQRATEAKEAYDIAAQQDTENVPIYLSPMIAGYWRN